MTQLLSLIEQAKRRRGINELFNGKNGASTSPDFNSEAVSGRSLSDLLADLDNLLSNHPKITQHHAPILITELEDIKTIL